MTAKLGAASGRALRYSDIPDHIKARFWERVAKVDDGCWLWTGTRVSPNGPGVLWWVAEGKNHHALAHRLALVLSGRDLEPGELAVLSCGTPNCVRAAAGHVVVVASQGDNIRAANARRRPDLSETAQAVRAGAGAGAGRTNRELAAEFGLHFKTVSVMVNGKKAYTSLGPLPVARPRYAGERQHLAKLTAAGVQEMRQRRADGEPVTRLAAAYGVSYSTAHDAISGVTWKEVPGACAQTGRSFAPAR